MHAFCQQTAMSHPVIWRPKTFFYPIGNTPAASYTEYLPPDVDASIFALGCGDPRSVFYTIDSDSKLSFDRSLDFTFCDTEPAVLARNVLLFTLLHENCDDKVIQNAWKIWFDVFIEKDSFDAIVSHCAKLVDLSSSLERWNSSPYGSFVKFCTLDTLQQLRHFWDLYTFKGRDAAKEKPSVLRDMKQMYTKKIGKGLVLTSARSAGMMVMEMTKLAHVHFKSYWETGVTGADPSEARKSSHVNPTLLHSSSGDTCNLHYGTDPMSCFHLAPALLPIQGEKRMPAEMVVELLLTMKAQFARWCRSFHTRTNTIPDKTILRFFVGDALPLCRALRYTAQTGEAATPEYADPWRAITITFTDDRPPLSFNVIDTSNLSDHLGPLNILLAAVPLLKREVSSALFTHTMINTKGDSTTNFQTVSALQKIGVDLSLLSLVFGVIPERVSSEHTSQSIAQEMVMSGLNDSYQYLEFNIWRVSTPEAPGKGFTFTSDPMELANALFAVYLSLFSDEALGGVIKGSTYVLKHYNRDSFASFLLFVKEAEDRTDRKLFLGMNNYQDLCRALHTSGLISIVPSPDRFPPADQEYCYQGWNDIPRVVCVAMCIPRSKFQHLLDDDHVCPPVHCRITNPAGNSIFWNIQTSFGHIEEVGAGQGRKLVVHEDAKGWRGSSDLIVHFVAPAWTFVQWGASQYELTFHMDGVHGLQFRPKLGLELCIFRTTAADRKRAFILKDRPRLAEQAEEGPNSFVDTPVLPALPRVVERQAVTVKFKGTVPAAFVARCSVGGDEAKANLSDKATQVEMKPTSVTSARISFKGFESTVYFPYPVDTNALVTRIARKSSYIEVEGRVTHTVKIPVELKPFPVVLTKSGPAELSMHHIALDNLPAIRSPIPQRFSDCGWLDRHLQFALTEEKRAAQIPGRQAPPLWDLKESIYNFYLSMIKVNKGKPTVFQLSDTGALGVHTIIFVSALRIDLTAHTVVADACVLPLSKDLVVQKPFQQALMNLNKTVQSLKTTTTDEEVPFWKAFLPTAVERCRTWEHRPGDECEYVKEGKVPLTLEIAKDPLCGCGRGKNLGGFEDVKEWAAFKPYVTRAAIGLRSRLRYLRRRRRRFATWGKVLVLVLVGEARALGVLPRQLRRLGRCKVTKYCSAGCQKADWKRHKAGCGK
ncbi:hypothetical protein NMY22_g2441 [Coprinellus aureogranulatus]|nr:hypothetical protein NMY22_g2441 [Coprinellus aureogranulatus]